MREELIEQLINCVIKKRITKKKWWIVNPRTLNAYDGETGEIIRWR